jgi:hypothetical protein
LDSITAFADTARLNGQDQALPEAELVVLEPSPDPASALPVDPR